ncbi:hypothetical protein PsYK624_080230 [Phanerochaete sordida]|uniref:Uncharacterized protein n=1 Tax=Phanerochaete sordida TaxID=48140 RepID=A0A9P3LFC2_9APHY|nr:hypothetical protein PsYK624_080230 [Phanerochaete sordida]
MDFAPAFTHLARNAPNYDLQQRLAADRLMRLAGSRDTSLTDSTLLPLVQELLAANYPACRPGNGVVGANPSSMFTPQRTSPAMPLAPDPAPNTDLYTYLALANLLGNSTSSVSGFPGQPFPDLVGVQASGVTMQSMDADLQSWADHKEQGRTVQPPSTVDESAQYGSQPRVDVVHPPPPGMPSSLDATRPDTSTSTVPGSRTVPLAPSHAENVPAVVNTGPSVEPSEPPVSR